MDNKERARTIEHISTRARLEDLALHVREGEVTRLPKIYAVLARIIHEKWNGVRFLI